MPSPAAVRKTSPRFSGLVTSGKITRPSGSDRSMAGINSERVLAGGRRPQPSTPR